jgi:hypothetical protein
MNQFEFTEKVREIIDRRLPAYNPDGMDTTIHPKDRKSHFYSFYLTVVNKAIGDLVSESSIAGYKIDDSREYIDSIALMESERNRLLNDLETCQNIVLFIVNHFRFTT